MSEEKVERDRQCYRITLDPFVFIGFIVNKIDRNRWVMRVTNIHKEKGKTRSLVLVTAHPSKFFVHTECPVKGERHDRE